MKILIFVSVIVIVSADESCHSFAEGNVYPRESIYVGTHEPQVSKVQISKPAPDWSATAVVDGKFQDLKLENFKGQYLVLLFYPLDFTFVCPTEIIAFSDRVEEFKNINAAVIAASVDSQFTHLAWINTPRSQGGLGNFATNHDE